MISSVNHGSRMCKAIHFKIGLSEFIVDTLDDRDLLVVYGQKYRPWLIYAHNIPLCTVFLANLIAQAAGQVRRLDLDKESGGTFQTCTKLTSPFLQLALPVTEIIGASHAMTHRNTRLWWSSAATTRNSSWGRSLRGSDHQKHPGRMCWTWRDHGISIHMPPAPKSWWCSGITRFHGTSSEHMFTKTYKAVRCVRTQARLWTKMSMMQYDITGGMKNGSGV